MSTIRLSRRDVEALLEKYRAMVFSEWSAEPSRTHDPEFFAVRDALDQEPKDGLVPPETIAAYLRNVSAYVALCDKIEADRRQVEATERHV